MLSRFFYIKYMPNQQKIDKIEAVSKKLSDSKSAALLQYQGLSATDISNLRTKVKQAGGSIEVVKNTLIIRALEKLGLKLPETLTGPTAIAYSETDEIAPLKEIDAVNKSKDKTFFKYGLYNQKLLSVDELTKFLSLPSKSTLIAQFIGGLKNPLERLVYSMRFNRQQLVLTLKAIADK